VGQVQPDADLGGRIRVVALPFATARASDELSSKKNSTWQRLAGEKSAR